MPFKLMRQSLLAVQHLCKTLLVMDGLTFPDAEWGFYYGLNEVTRKLDNPTHKKMQAVIITWLQFYWRLLKMLPKEHELRIRSQAELMKLSAPYRSLLDEGWMNE